jgi:hypothetical protein
MATYSGKLLQWDACLNSKVDVFPYDAGDPNWDTKPPVMPIGDGVYQRPIPGTTKVV